MTEIRKVAPVTLTAQVAQQLRDQVTSGELRPGDRLPSERDLATQFGVGRPVVREALRELRTQGLISTARGPLGATVQGPALPTLSTPSQAIADGSAEHLLEVMELRSALEVEAAGLAARRATLDDLHHLERLVTGGPDLDPAETDVAFHAAVARAAHNPLFRQLSGELVDALQHQLPALLGVLYTQTGGSAAIAQQHAAVLQGIRTGDEAQTREAMRRHLAYVARSLAALTGMAPPVRLVVVDVEGALLAGRESPTERTRTAIGAAREAGVEVVLASNRPPRIVRHRHQQLGLAGPVIAYGGAVLWDYEGNLARSRRSLDPALVADAVQLARAVGAVANLESDDEWFADRITERTQAEQRRRATQESPTVAGIDALLASGEPIDKMFADLRDLPAAAQAETRFAFLKLLEGRARIVETSPGLIELLSNAASKAALAQELTRARGLPADQVMAIAHADRDVPLLRWAGIGVAMGNASPAAKEAADVITSSNLRDGVAEALEQWVLGAASA